MLLLYTTNKIEQSMFTKINADVVDCLRTQKPLMNTLQGFLPDYLDLAML